MASTLTRRAAMKAALRAGAYSVPAILTASVIAPHVAAATPTSVLSFTPVATYSVPVTAEGVAVADLNGDGNVDLALPANHFNILQLLLGRGDGTFSVVPSTIPTGRGPEGITAADFNRDGKNDLAVANSLDNTVSIFLGNGDGTFRPRVDYPVGQNPDIVAVGDFNGDGILDLAVNGQLDNSVSVLLGRGDGTFLPRTVYTVPGSPSDIGVGDFNRDAKLDLITANSRGESVSVLLGRGDGTFQPPITTAAGPGSGGVCLGDLNGDGRLDAVVANSPLNGAPDVFSVLLGKGDGTFQPRVSYTYTGSSPFGGSALGDVNGDGILDIVKANQNARGDTVTIFLGRGDGTFVQVATFPTNGSGITLADVNRDGKPDLLVNNGTGTLTVWLNTTR
ncbi:MAG: VCBS repeat-containing protein [Thermomicrobia bacterium]|nr:VCBS repeat-containing protein [Thermomicrobia bacterium]MCA1724683.1 VCBS repeat-containing protein [Thermomicrobia bacterium]